MQGLIKFMEPEVNVKCRKSDFEVVKKAIEPAITEYKALLKKEVKIFHDRDVPCKVNVDDGKWLPEFNENEGTESCLGGIIIHCRKGRIYCSNTLDDRL
jgi:V-type H+-transporting ATPase subunit E